MGPVPSYLSLAATRKTGMGVKKYAWRDTELTRAFKPMPSALTVPLLVSPDNQQYAQGAIQTHTEAGIWARHIQISTNVALKVQQPRKRVLHSLQSINPNPQPTTLNLKTLKP